MVEVGYVKVAEGSIRVPQDSVRLRVNPNQSTPKRLVAQSVE
jgi:hypothetical protein